MTKISLLFRKNYDILYLYYDILHTGSHNFDARCHNMSQDVIIFPKNRSIFCHSRFSNKKIELQALNACWKVVGQNTPSIL